MASEVHVASCKASYMVCVFPPVCVCVHSKKKSLGVALGSLGCVLGSPEPHSRGQALAELVSLGARCSGGVALRLRRRMQPWPAHGPAQRLPGAPGWPTHLQSAAAAVKSAVPVPPAGHR